MNQTIPNVGHGWLYSWNESPYQPLLKEEGSSVLVVPPSETLTQYYVLQGYDDYLQNYLVSNVLIIEFFNSADGTHQPDSDISLLKFSRVEAVTWIQDKTFI